MCRRFRELERESYSRPFEGAARVLLIEDADRLNDVAANALLKTLEEPPSSSHLILITSRPAALLPTIRSRCQMLRFTPLTATEISDYLQTSQTSKTRKLVAADAPLLVAQIAQGSLGRALALDLNSYREQRSLMIEILESLASGEDRAKLLRASESLSDPKQKDGYEERLQILETLIHDLWTVKFGENTSSQLINYDMRPQLLRLANQVTLGRARRWLEQIDETRRQLAVNINRRVATDSLLLTMAETKARHALPA
ncbi:MAG: DNA polymerase III subunit delta' C-terminal domain-containing protein [Pyrinomonadaceae bacterium]